MGSGPLLRHRTIPPRDQAQCSITPRGPPSARPYGVASFGNALPRRLYKPFGQRPQRGSPPRRQGLLHCLPSRARGCNPFDRLVAVPSPHPSAAVGTSTKVMSESLPVAAAPLTQRTRPGREPPCQLTTPFWQAMARPGGVGLGGRFSVYPPRGSPGRLDLLSFGDADTVDGEK